MQFTLSTIVGVAMLATQGSAFVMDTFSSGNCSGSRIQSVNVWDNTCARWPTPFQSFKITSYGGSHQHAYFFTASGCGDLGSATHTEWVDGGGAKIGACVSMAGHSINAVASYRG